MHVRARALLLAVVFAYVATAAAIAAPVTASARPFAVPAALGASGVPVLLPVRLPATFGTPLRIAVIDADRDGYYIGFSSVRGCGGALSCSTLHLAGYRMSPSAQRVSAGSRRLRLTDGSSAVYTPPDCSGAACTEAVLRFSRGPATYEIDAKVGRAGPAPLVAVYRTLRPFVRRHHLQPNQR